MTETNIADKAKETYPFIFKNKRGALRNEDGRLIKYGIPEPQGKRELMKGGDYVGFSEVEITPEMVGKKIAVFVNIEIKTETDTLMEGQIRWHNWILSKGGISEIWKENKDGKIDIKKTNI